MHELDWTLPTAQFLGRFQPWHEGHRAVFEQILAQSTPGYKNKKHDAQQVCIMVRVQEVSDEAPHTFYEVRDTIDADLRLQYEGRYTIIAVPNITNVFYGRTVGYDVHRVHLSEELETLDSKTIRAECAAVEARFFKNRG